VSLGWDGLGVEIQIRSGSRPWQFVCRCAGFVFEISPNPMFRPAFVRVKFGQEVKEGEISPTVTSWYGLSTRCLWWLDEW
jgi:hypothetical protein